MYSSGTYSAGPDSTGKWVVNKRTSGTDELRESAIGTLSLEPTPRAGMTIRAGVERTRNIMFTGGRRRSYVADVGLRWRP
jgi:hypothetical protein